MAKQKSIKKNDKRYTEIGYNVAYYRKHRGITQEQLAEKLDFHASTLELLKLLILFVLFLLICFLISQMC